ncbi:MAG: YdcF family protein [Eubacterium sp.]|nr:YdcF family protein [Eubacterium sp.]
MKKIIKLTLIILGVFIIFIFLAPAAARIFHIGSIVGIVIGVVFLGLGLMLDKVLEIVKNIMKSKKGRIIFGSAVTAVIAIGLSFSIALGSVIISGETNATDQNVVIVLGCAVYGETPSIMLKKRVNSAYEYLTKNEDSVAVLSGGQGNGESISEAECMRRLLTEKGIDESRLYLEDQSTNTAENIANSKKILEENNLGYDVAIATSDYHLKRATMIAERNGLTAARISSHSGFFDVPSFYIRDTLGVIKEFIFG